MIPRFRTGQLKACPYLLEAIPRTVMIRAIVAHATTEPRDGPIRTEHRHGEKAFVIVTEPCRRVTRLELA